jgi:hypothetical protein
VFVWRLKSAANVIVLQISEPLAHFGANCFRLSQPSGANPPVPTLVPYSLGHRDAPLIQPKRPSPCPDSKSPSAAAPSRRRPASPWEIPSACFISRTLAPLRTFLAAHKLKDHSRRWQPSRPSFGSDAACR